MNNYSVEILNLKFSTFDANSTEKLADQRHKRLIVYRYVKTFLILRMDSISVVVYSLSLQ